MANSEHVGLWLRPASGTFKMFGQTGPFYKLQGDSIFDLSLDRLSFCHSLQCWPKNQKMLQPDAFCEHKSTMQQNATADRGLRWGSLQRSHRPFSWIKGRGMGKEERGRKGREGRSTVMRSWNRAADWLRPALNVAKNLRAYCVPSSYESTPHACALQMRQRLITRHSDITGWTKELSI